LCNDRGELPLAVIPRIREGILHGLGNLPPRAAVAPLPKDAHVLFHAHDRAELTFELAELGPYLRAVAHAPSICRASPHACGRRSSPARVTSLGFSGAWACGPSARLS